MASTPVTRRSALASLFAGLTLPAVLRGEQAPEPHTRAALAPEHNAEGSVPTKRGLVLSGGSIKGAFQAGAVAQLLRDGFVPDVITGISIGSLNAAFIADQAGRSVLKHQPIDWPAVGDALEEFWRTNVTRPASIIEPVSNPALAGSILLTRFEGFVTTGPLRHLIQSTLDIANIRACPAVISVGAVNVVDGRLTNAKKDSPNFIDYVLASAALPLIMPLVKVGSAHFTDGGIRDIAPLASAIEQGANDIVCVLCQAEHLAAHNFNQRSLFQLADRLMDIISNEILANDLLRRTRFQQLIAALDDRLGTQNAYDLRVQVFSPIGLDLRAEAVLPRVIRPADEIDVDLQSFTSDDIKKMLADGRFTATQPH
jgi:NTE family protein